MQSFPTLETPRLILRPITESDIDAIYNACSNPKMTEHTLFETHLNRDVTVNFLKQYVMPNYAAGIPDPFGIALKDSPHILIGCTGGRWTESRCNASVELGYWIAEPHWNHGYATEAVKALIPYLFETLEPVRIQAHCMAPNVASARVLEKAGMTFEGLLRQAFCRRGVHWDIKMYSVLKP
ncbi:N/A [soil metagenome]